MILYYRSGLEKDQNTLRNRWFNDDPPSLIWFEPRPGLAKGAKRGPVVEVLVQELPEPWPVLDELRLFWSDQAVHLVSTDQGWRWFEYSESATLADELVVQTREVNRSTASIASRHNWDILAAKKPGVLGKSVQKLQVVEYAEPDQGGRLFAWRLIP